jgi:hypothetical protein
MAILAVFPLASAQEQIMLETTSDQGTFRIEILWTPAEIGSGNTFVICFLDSETGREVEDMRYDLLVFKDGSQSPEVRRAGQTATVQHLSFDEPGRYVVRIDDIDGLGEGAQLPIQVTPEFPLALVAAAAAVGIAVIAAKSNRLAD